MNNNKNKKKFRVIFCANQVSLCIAVSLAKKDREFVDSIVFFMPARCDPLAYKDFGVELIPYTRWSFVQFLIFTLLRRPNEMCVPHMITGRLINAFAKYARVLSAIDDGMDTFREKPRNIVPENFSRGAKYYTFDYNFPLATWLDQFAIEKVCNIRNLAISSRPQAVLSNIKKMVIESPGISDIHHQQEGDLVNTLIVKHSNRNKNSMNYAGMKSVSGSDIGLEKTIDKFAGTLFVGESMVMVYALLCGENNLKITVMLTRNTYDNLHCLQVLFNKPSRNGLFLSIK